MGIDGTYGFVYCGNRGLGAGVFSIKGERLEGRDFAGSNYNGTATPDGDGNIVLDVQMVVPSGVVLVQGSEPLDLSHNRQIKHSLAGDLDERGEAPILLHRGIVAQGVVEDRNLCLGSDGRLVTLPGWRRKASEPAMTNGASWPFLLLLRPQPSLYPSQS
jgi:hypothetical protein